MTRTIPGRNFTQSNVQAGLIFTLCHRLDNPSVPKNSEQITRYLPQNSEPPPGKPINSNKNSEPPPNKPINSKKWRAKYALFTQNSEPPSSLPSQRQMIQGWQNYHRNN